MSGLQCNYTINSEFLLKNTRKTAIFVPFGMAHFRQDECYKLTTVR